jgi:ferritin-like metal-binding protein YciE
MTEKTLRNLFVDELRDIYDAENQLIKALPKMAEHAHSDELKRAFRDHLEQTRIHVRRVEDIFGQIKEKRESKNCAAMKGIVNEGEEMMREFSKSSALDAALISAAQKVEHYEMASYGSLRAFAEQLKLDGVADKLQSTLNEEGEANSLLTRLAIHGINYEARA